MSSRGKIPLALAVALLMVKAVALALDPASLSPRLLPNLFTLAVFVLLLRSWQRRRDPATPPAGWPRRAASGALLLLGTLVIAHIGTLAYVDHQLRQRSPNGAPDHPLKVWAARGLVVGTDKIVRDGEQNSIESIRRAFDRGAQGCEVDVFYDVDLAAFVVSHDRPYHLKNGAVLTLRQLLAEVGGRGSLWLDWKALRHLDAAQLDAACKELHSLADSHDLHARLYVEGEAPFPIRTIRRAGLKTIFDVRPLSDAHPLTPLIADLYKMIYYFGDHTVMSMNSGSAEQPIYGPEVRRCLRRVPVFLYHVPDDETLLAELVAENNVRALLVVDHSADRYQLRAPATAQPVQRPQ